MKVGIHGHVRVEVDGKVIYDGPNLLTYVGYASIASQLLNDGDPPSYAAIGTGITPANVLDTTLETEETVHGLARVFGNGDPATTVVADDTSAWTFDWTVAGSASMSEIGLFTDSSGGIMVARRVFSPVSLTDGQTVRIVWSLQVGAV